MMERSVVVTGSGTGIGAAIAADLAEHGWIVVGLELGESDETSRGACAAIVEGDVADPEAHRRAADRARELAPLGGWVNNAGIGFALPIHRLDEDRARRMIEVNGLGALWGCSAALAAFVDQATPGAIVNIGSIHGRRAFRDRGVYEFTKGGIEALTRGIAVSYAPYGIRANTVAPGSVMTPHLAAQVRNAADPVAEERGLAEGPPMARIGRASEIAAAVRFLLSEDASYITGESLGVDGGWSAVFGTPARDAELDERFGRTAL
jgi:NAD(P)-dependent dehydrogenase (short-subunit alcohol dehydrogenase family)